MKPRIAVWDIETGLQSALVFDLQRQRASIPHDGLLTERYIICGAWQWLGEKRVHSVSQADYPRVFTCDPHDDYRVVARLRAMLSEADAVIAHYGDNFDMKYFNTRCIVNGQHPVHNLTQIDTYKMATRKFKFNNNRLDYLGKRLVGYGKAPSSMKMWRGCFHGEPRQVRKMTTYCKQDVKLLTAVYNKMAPFVTPGLNMRIFTGRAVCENCASEYIHYRGYRYTRKTKWREYVCKDCHNWGSHPASQPERKHNEILCK